MDVKQTEQLPVPTGSAKPKLVELKRLIFRALSCKLMDAGPVLCAQLCLHLRACVLLPRQFRHAPLHLLHRQNVYNMGGPCVKVKPNIPPPRWSVTRGFSISTLFMQENNIVLSEISCTEVEVSCILYVASRHRRFF